MDGSGRATLYRYDRMLAAAEVQNSHLLLFRCSSDAYAKSPGCAKGAAGAFESSAVLYALHQMCVLQLQDLIVQRKQLRAHLVLNADHGQTGGSE